MPTLFQGEDPTLCQGEESTARVSRFDGDLSRIFGTLHLRGGRVRADEVLASTCAGAMRPASYYEWEFRTRLSVMGTKEDFYQDTVAKIEEGLRGDVCFWSPKKLA